MILDKSPCLMIHKMYVVPVMIDLQGQGFLEDSQAQLWALGMTSCIHFHPQHWTPSGSPLCRFCAPCRLGGLMFSLVLLHLEDHVSLVFSILSGSYNLSASSSSGLPQPWDEGIGGDIPLDQSVSRQLTPCSLSSSGSLFVPIYCSRKLL